MTVLVSFLGRQGTDFVRSEDPKSASTHFTTLITYVTNNVYADLDLKGMRPYVFSPCFCSQLYPCALHWQTPLTDSRITSRVVQVSWFMVNFLQQTEFRDPGYKLQLLTETNTGLTARLRLAGPACNAFGTDVDSLTVEVTYETQSRYVPCGIC